MASVRDPRKEVYSSWSKSWFSFGITLQLVVVHMEEMVMVVFLCKNIHAWDMDCLEIRFCLLCSCCS